MPKSNFNQFLDECEDYRPVEKTSSSMMSKIIFETKPTMNTNHMNAHPNPNSCYENYEECKNNYNQNGQSNQNMTLFFSSKSNSVREHSSSNIFLSKHANRQDTFSKSYRNNKTNTRNENTSVNASKMNTNIFKNIQDDTYDPIPNLSPITPTIEITNETFPSLKSTTTAATTAITNREMISKKFKNFKDAICASAPVVAPVLSHALMKPKQTPPLPLPVAIKRDGEMYAKQVLRKMKKDTTIYDENNDDDDDDDNGSNDYDEFAFNNRKSTIIKRQFNDYGEDSDYD